MTYKQINEKYAGKSFDAELTPGVTEIKYTKNGQAVRLIYREDPEKSNGFNFFCTVMLDRDGKFVKVFDFKVEDGKNGGEVDCPIRTFGDFLNTWIELSMKSEEAHYADNA